MRGSSLEQTVPKLPVCLLKSLLHPHTMSLHGVPHTTSSFCSTSLPSLSPNTLHMTGNRSPTNATPRLGGQSGHLAETTQSTVYEPKTCIDVSSEYTLINFPIRRRQLQPSELLENLRLWGFWPSSTTINSKQQPTFGGKRCTSVVEFGFVIQHWETGARVRVDRRFIP